MSRRALVWALVVGGLALHAGLDVRQRARVDRGARLHRTDFTVYQAAARALRDGDDPYEARNPRGWRYVYPPLLAVLLMPVAGWDPPDAALLFHAVSVGALLWLLGALARLPAPGGGALGWAAVLLATLGCSGFLLQSFQRGQVTVVLLALEVGGIVAALRGRPWLAGLLLAVGGALRLTPLLTAAALGVGGLAAARAGGARRLAGLSAGVALGLVLCFGAVPALALGPERAVEVTKRWLAVGESLYASAPGRLEALEDDYRINESRFKNQAPRRVFATWAGWATGASFERERPDLAEPSRSAVDGAALGVAGLLLALALAVGWRRLRDPAAPGFAASCAVVTALPLLMTRYAWPTHYVAALPLLAFAWAGAAPRAAPVLFVVATALFYAAHAEPLEVLGAAGVLMLGLAVLVAASLRRPAAAR